VSGKLGDRDRQWLEPMANPNCVRGLADIAGEQSPIRRAALASSRVCQRDGRGNPSPKGGASGPGNMQPATVEKTATGIVCVSCNTNIGAHIDVSAMMTSGSHAERIGDRSSSCPGSVPISHSLSSAFSRKGCRPDA